MKKTKDWPKVAAGGLSTCASLYIIVPVSGYLVYGNEVASPVVSHFMKGSC